jgi:hypothetical protein
VVSIKHWRLQATLAGEAAAARPWAAASGSEGLLHAPNARRVALIAVAVMNLAEFLVRMTSPVWDLLVSLD